jgi:ribosomal protein S18 acetylase RimI-like enzyme
MIRPLAAADLPALAEGLAALPLMQRYGRTAGKLEAALAAALRRGEGLLVATEDGANAPVLGLAWFLPAGTLALGGYLRLIAVLGEGQGRGTGAALLEAFEGAVARESAHAFLLVSDFNEPAQRFYERKGYVRVGALPGLVLPDVGEVLYWKRLR